MDFHCGATVEPLWRTPVEDPWMEDFLSLHVALAVTGGNITIDNTVNVRLELALEQDFEG